MKVTCCFLLIFTFTRISDVSSADGCEPKVLQKCAQPLLGWTGDGDGWSPPSNMQEAIAHCDDVRNATTCIRSYLNQCTPSLVRQMGKLAVGSMRKELDKVCSPEGIDKLLHHRECIESFVSEGQYCYHTMVREMYRVEKVTDKMQIVGGVCCYLTKYHDCVMDHIKDTCREDSSTWAEQEGGKLMDELTEMMCPPSTSWGQSKCNELNSTLPAAVITSDGEPSIIPLLFTMIERVSGDS